MDARKYWETYVERHDGAAGVAAHLSIPYSTIAGICNGSRGIGRRLAERMAESDPLLDAKVLVWVQPLRKQAA
ncbi:hypothetical protein [Lysobacter sp. Hz 25]|uniref:hypothetical protein n=1 Tax=Lysobacter sp. Hz 25 TaxID=3383698 RepID=UPI0038D3E5F1